LALLFLLCGRFPHNLLLSILVTCVWVFFPLFSSPELCSSTFPTYPPSLARLGFFQRDLVVCLRISLSSLLLWLPFVLTESLFLATTWFVLPLRVISPFLHFNVVLRPLSFLFCARFRCSLCLIVRLHFYPSLPQPVARVFYPFSPSDSPLTIERQPSPLSVDGMYGLSLATSLSCLVPIDLVQCLGGIFSFFFFAFAHAY